MRRLLLTAVIVGAAVSILLATMLGGASQNARASAPGPQIGFGSTALVSGKVQIPIVTSGTGFASYAGFAIHLRWTPGLFSFSSATNTGGVFDPGGFCPAPDTTTFDGDGGGVTYACTSLTGPKTGTGQLALISLTPLGTGCSPIHFFTFGPPDGGDDASGTYTVDGTSFTEQANVYAPDIAVNQAGAACVPPGSPTATPTATNTPSPTPSPTATNSPTPTNTVISGAPDMTVAGVSLPPNTDGGLNVSYSITLSNVGDVAATGVQLDMALVPGMLPFKNANCKTYSAGHFLCNVSGVAAHDSVTLIVTAQEPISTSNLVVHLPLHVSATNEPVGSQGNNDNQITTSIRGCPDITGDDVINIIDFSAAAGTYGLSLGDPGYNPLVDQNGDNTITVADFAIMATRYGAHCKGKDSDHDGISDYDEINVFGTNPTNADTDGDGLPDGIEVLTYGSNPLLSDTSGDGYSDGEKAALGKDPTNYCLIMAADIDHSGVVNIIDFSAMAASYGLSTGDPGFNPRADLDKSGKVTILDFSKASPAYGGHIDSCP